MMVVLVPDQKPDQTQTERKNLLLRPNHEFGIVNVKSKS